MITYEQDPDVVRWGLQLFDGDPYANCGYCGSVAQHNADCYSGNYIKGYQYDADCSYTGDPNLNINCLQEGLSQLSVNEPVKPFQDGVEHLQTPFCSQDWFPHTLGNYSYVVDGNDNHHEEETDFGNSASCSSPGDQSYCGDEWSHSLDLMDEYSFDGEVGKRLNQMVPIPHIPKINGEIPSLDEATLDHQRLLDRLQVYELVEFKVQGDGNCQGKKRVYILDKQGGTWGIIPSAEAAQAKGRYNETNFLPDANFRALSDQFYRSPEHHKFVRQQIVNQLRSCPEIYEGYVPMAYEHYLTKMSKSGEWGDHVTLQAAADSYGIKIFVITSFKDTCYIEILPSIQKSERVIFLSFWAEVHYNSIYPAGDCPTFRTKKKKRWQAPQHEHIELPDDYNCWTDDKL